MKKTKALMIALSSILFIFLFAGCSAKAPDAANTPYSGEYADNMLIVADDNTEWVDYTERNGQYTIRVPKKNPTVFSDYHTTSSRIISDSNYQDNDHCILRIVIKSNIKECSV